MSELKDRIKAVIAEQLGVAMAEVTDNADFIKDLGADSLDTVELVMALEEAFEIEIPDEVAEKVRTVEDVVSLVSTETA